MKSILALDLGTTTGWAFRSRAGNIAAGSWLLQAEKDRKRDAKVRLDRRLDARVPALYERLSEFDAADFVVFEDVQFSKYTLQTQLWASFRAAVWLFCHNHKIFIDCCPVTTLKKFGTGSGAADKASMMREAARLFPGVPIVDDNCADALHLLQWAITITRRAK